MTDSGVVQTTTQEIAKETHCTPEQRTASPWQFLWFFPHVAVIYIIVNFCTGWLAGWTRAVVLPLFGIQSNSSGQFEFLFSHLFLFSFLPAFLVGFVNLQFKHRSAAYAWTVPAVVLAYKLATFSYNASVLSSPSLSAFQQYFSSGFLIPEYHNWEEFWQIARSDPDMLRGMAQLQFTSPFYAGLGYSLSAWLSLRTTLDQVLLEKFKTWEKGRFASVKD